MLKSLRNVERWRSFKAKPLFNHICSSPFTLLTHGSIDLQSVNRTSSLSWQESLSGPRHTPVWTCVCKIDGVARGTGTGTLKHVAKDLAADEAWESLTSEQPSR